jgi:hypothetical protein
MSAPGKKKEENQPTFTAHFTDCAHNVEIPLVHSAGHKACFLCQPDLRQKPMPGLCPSCYAEKADSDNNARRFYNDGFE